MRKLAILLAVSFVLPLVVQAADTNITIGGRMEFNAIHRDNVFDWDDDGNYGLRSVVWNPFLPPPPTVYFSTFGTNPLPFVNPWALPFGLDPQLRWYGYGYNAALFAWNLWGLTPLGRLSRLPAVLALRFPEVELPSRGPDGLLGTADDGRDDRENFVDLYLTLDITAELTQNVTAMVQLGNRRHEADRFGEDGFVLEVKEAWVEMREFLVPELKVKLGLQNFAYSLRDDGNYFLLNTKETFQLGKDKEDYGVDVGGVRFTYDLTETMLPVTAELFWFRANDPGVFTDWLDVYGLTLDYKFPDEKSHIQFAAINFHDNTSTSNFSYTDVLRQYPTYITTVPLLGGYEPIVQSGDWWALSLGAQYFIPVGEMELELYGEGVWQTGDYSSVSFPNPYRSASDQTKSLDMDAFGGRIGAELSMPNTAWAPKIGASYWYRSGDDKPADGDQENFVSYGKTVETLIVEDALYGMNLNTNYEVWRISVQVQPKEDLTVKLQYNDFSLVEDKFQRGYVPPRPWLGRWPLVYTSTSSEDDLGQEIDLISTWTYSPNVAFTLGVGYFMPGDFIEKNPRMGRRTKSVTQSNGADDDALLVNLRTVVTF